MVRTIIESSHPSAQRALGTGRLRGRGNELSREADFAADTATWYRAISRYLASIRCPDTLAQWPESIEEWRRSHPTHLPFRFVMIGNRALISAVPNGSPLKVGDLLESIEGRRIGDMRSDLTPWISSTQPAAQFARLLDVYGLILYGLRSEFRVRVAGQNYTVPALNHPTWLDLSGRTPAAVEISTPALNVVRITVRRMEDEVELTSLDATLARGRANPRSRVILDLRNAQGDSAKVSEGLLSRLGGSGVEREKESGFTGPIDILTDPTTGSMATHLASQLKSRRNVRIIGEPGDGSATGTNAGPARDVKLPYSGIRLRIPTTRTRLPGSDSPLQRLRVDVTKRPSEADVLGPGDSVFEWTLQNPRATTEDRQKNAEKTQRRSGALPR